MARRHGRLKQTISVTAGATNGQTVIGFILPFGCKLDRIDVIQVTAGTGTGTFSLLVEEFTTGTDLTDSLTAVDADSAAETFHGTLNANSVSISGDRLLLATNTTKTGTVSASPVMAFDIYFYM